jgi:hypothetical protein
VAGSELFVNLYIGVPETLTAFELNQLEEEIVTALKAERKCHRPIVLPRIVFVLSMWYIHLFFFQHQYTILFVHYPAGSHHTCKPVSNPYLWAPVAEKYPGFFLLRFQQKSMTLALGDHSMMFY